MSYFNNKVVVVTGGSDGIGKALIDILIAQGARVATCGRNYDKLYSLQVQYTKVLLHTMACDVSNENDCKRFIESTIEIFGGIDILINNAGINIIGLFKDDDEDIQAIRRIMEVNFFGAVYCTRFALPSILERKGTIVGVSSIAGYRGLPGRSGYSASKFALQGWLEALRTELLTSGVHVMWVCPGFTRSNIRNEAFKQSNQPEPADRMDENKMMSPEECAAHILHAIEKKKRSLVLTFNGKSAVFMNKFFPSWADKLTHNFYFKKGELTK